MGPSLNEEDDIIESPLLNKVQIESWMETPNVHINDNYYEKRWLFYGFILYFKRCTNN